MTNKKVADQLHQKLTLALKPGHLAIHDESHLHAGHAGARREGESHFHLEITSDAFRNLSRVEAQRRVYQILAEEMAGPVHALRLTLKTPAEN